MNMAAEEKKENASKEQTEPENETAGSGSAEVEQSAEAKEDSPKEPDWKDQYARLLADFDNYKKRMARDREDTYRYAKPTSFRAFCRSSTICRLRLTMPKTDGTILSCRA